MRLIKIKGEKNTRKLNIQTESNRNFKIRFGFFGFSVSVRFEKYKEFDFSVRAKKNRKIELYFKCNIMYVYFINLICYSIIYSIILFF